MKISIGNDHAGPEYKKAIVKYLESKGIEVINHGTDTAASVDYADFVHPVAIDVENGSVDLGIIICGSGNGASMTANKHQGIRAAICWQEELAVLARSHNNANIVCIPQRFITIEEAKKIIQAFLTTDFEGGRHATRVNKMTC